MITAVILHYYSERRGNLEPIVKALLAGEVKPNRIVIWNNNHQTALEPIEGAIIINSGVNLGCGIRHLIALAFPADHYFFQDDDLQVRPETLQAMVSKAKEVPHAIVGTEFYEPGVVLGRCHLCAPEALVNTLTWRVRNGLELPLRTDDIMLGVANQESRFIKSVLADFAGEPFDNLPDGERGLSSERPHAEERRRFYKTYKKLDAEI